MAINFPNTPANGEEFTDPGSLTTWRYNSAWDAWTSVSAGVSNINYRGGINFTVTYVENNIVPQAGDIYNNNTDGTAHPNFTGIAGEPVAVGALYLYDGTNWNSLDLQASPFTRDPATGIITPVRGGDDLDMTVAGSYLIDTLNELN